MKRTISVILENQPGALSRVVGLFSQRGYNIEALNVAPMDDKSLSLLTIVTIGDERQLDQIMKHLTRLIDVVSLEDTSKAGQLQHELA